MGNIEVGLKIIEQFRLMNNDWGLRSAFWIVIQHMLKIDQGCIDPEWLKPRLFDALKEAGDTDEVPTSAIRAVMKILPRFSNIQDITSELFNMISSSDDIDPYNYPALKALHIIITKCDYNEFIDEDTFSVISYTRNPTRLIRKAAYTFLRDLFELKDHEVYEDFNFFDYALKLIESSLNEEDKELFPESVNLLNCYFELMKYHDYSFDAQFAVNVCDFLAKDIKKMYHILPLLIEFAKHLKIKDDHPVFKQCKTIWGIAFLIILCLHNNTLAPIFADIKPEIFSKNPLGLLLSLFSLNNNVVPEDNFLNSVSQLFSSIRLFVCKYVGRFLKDEQDDQIISKLIFLNIESEKAIMDNFKETDRYSDLITTIKREPKVFTARLIAINSVYEPPENLYSIHSLLQFYYCIEAGIDIHEKYLNILIDTMQNGDRYFGSFAAFIANSYCQKPNYENLLSLFVVFIERNFRELSISCIEFIDLLLSDFQTKSIELLKWASFFVEICLYNIANQNDFIRRMASHSLAQIVGILPLDDGDCSNIPSILHESKKKSMKYLRPLFDISQAERCTLNPFPDFSSIPNGKIKDYQYQGINWLWFLYNYGLNGILADDMGLGKTFQCLSIISNSHHIEKSGAISIVICPSSVIHHWDTEIQKFYPQIPTHPIVMKSELNANQFMTMNGIIIISYQNIISLFSILTKRKFTYCVLDEGHIIKNKNTKASEAVMKIQAQHRLILSGTPIQNNVTELWTLMDFLMPGFLGTREEFQKKYQRPIKKMFKPEATEAETENGQKVLNVLHNQVLPFIMRRLKANVMMELPKKVIYDEVFKMTDKQREVLQKVRANINLDTNEIDENTFKKLHNERKVCIHPSLVDESIPKLIEYSAKLTELKKLLLSRLGFGGGNLSMRNRALIFAISRKTLLITQEVLLSTLNGITFSVLDGKVPEKDRPAIIDNFNREDGPDLLLLTTSVGGLGLNLQRANIVIFLENSWNFTEDDQAIARAHRMGQNRQVTVFNLITDETIESRILEVQQQKRKVASTIINDENADVLNKADQIFAEDLEPNKPATNKRMTLSQLANEAFEDTSGQYKEDYKSQDKLFFKDNK